MSSVAVKLADCANDDGENVYPSVNRVERETRLGQSTVRRILAAFEEAGLLEVIEETSGNRWNRSTTIRRFCMEKLHDLSAVEVRRDHAVVLTPSTHVLKEVLVGNRTVWAVVLRGPDDTSDYDRFVDPPLPQREGHATSTPPAAGGVPLPLREGAPPAAGPNPSLEPPSRLFPPAPAKRGSRERGRKSNAVEDAIQLVRSERPDVAARVAAVDTVLAPIVRRLRLDAPSLDGSLRSLADWIGVKALTAHEATTIAAAVLKDRRASVKPSDIERAVKSQLALRAPAARLSGDPDLAGRWPEALAVLEGMVGATQFASWCTTLVPFRRIGARLQVASHQRFVAVHVEREFAASLRVAVQSVWPDVSAVEIVSRRAA